MDHHHIPTDLVRLSAGYPELEGPLVSPQTRVLLLDCRLGLPKERLADDDHTPANDDDHLHADEDGDHHHDTHQDDEHFDPNRHNNTHGDKDRHTDEDSDDNNGDSDNHPPTARRDEHHHTDNHINYDRDGNDDIDNDSRSFVVAD